MAGSQPTSQSLRAQRQKMADGGEPLYTEERLVRDLNGSLYVNLTEYGSKTHEFEAGETVEVHTIVDGVLITTPNDDE